MDRWIVSFVSSVFLFLFSFFVCFFNIGLVIKENCTLLEEEIPVCKRITKKFSSLKEKKKSLISRLLKINHFILKILFVIVIFFFQFMEAHQFQSPNRNWEWLQPASVCTGPRGWNNLSTPPLASPSSFFSLDATSSGIHPNFCKARFCNSRDPDICVFSTHHTCHHELSLPVYFLSEPVSWKFLSAGAGLVNCWPLALRTGLVHPRSPTVLW